MQNATDTLPIAYVVDPKGRIRFCKYAPHLNNLITYCREKKSRVGNERFIEWRLSLTEDAREKGFVFLKDLYAAEKFDQGWETWEAYHKADHAGRLRKYPKTTEEGKETFIVLQNEPFKDEFLPKEVLRRRDLPLGSNVEPFAFPTSIQRPAAPSHTSKMVTDLQMHGDPPEEKEEMVYDGEAG